jgi:hypothetical protein
VLPRRVLGGAPGRGPPLAGPPERGLPRVELGLGRPELRRRPVSARRSARDGRLTRRHALARLLRAGLRGARLRARVGRAADAHHPVRVHPLAGPHHDGAAVAGVQRERLRQRVHHGHPSGQRRHHRLAVVPRAGERRRSPPQHGRRAAAPRRGRRRFHIGRVVDQRHEHALAEP